MSRLDFSREIGKEKSTLLLKIALASADVAAADQFLAVDV
jgi:hypothetical protein